MGSATSSSVEQTEPSVYHFQEPSDLSRPTSREQSPGPQPTGSGVGAPAAEVGGVNHTGSPLERKPLHERTLGIAGMELPRMGETISRWIAAPGPDEGISQSRYWRLDLLTRELGRAKQLAAGIFDDRPTGPSRTYQGGLLPALVYNSTSRCSRRGREFLTSESRSNSDMDSRAT